MLLLAFKVAELLVDNTLVFYGALGYQQIRGISPYLAAENLFNIL